MIYLNNAATSWPKPSSVCEAVQACLMGTPASQFRGGSAILKKDTEERCREKLGKLLGIHAHDRIFFTSGATESLNTVLCGLDYGEEGRGILATQTEHNSVLRPLMNQPVFNNHFLPGKWSSYPEGTGKRFGRSSGKHREKSVSSYCKPLFQCDRICAGYEADWKFCKRK